MVQLAAVTLTYCTMFARWSDSPGLRFRNAAKGFGGRLLPYATLRSEWGKNEKSIKGTQTEKNLLIAIADGASDTMYTGTSDGRVYVTTDAATWNLRNTGVPAVHIPDIAIDPNDWQTAYFCAEQSTGDRVFVTSDAGGNCVNITGALPTGLRAMSMAVDFRTTPACTWAPTMESTLPSMRV